MYNLLTRPAPHPAFSRWLYLGLSLILFLSISLARPGLALAVSITEYPIPTADSYPQRITSGPDSNLWFTETEANKIGRITPAGVVTEYPILTDGSYPYGITSGPDGNIWFTEQGSNKIGRITPAGVITEFPILTAYGLPFDITSGPDGNLWFLENNGNKVGKITPAGVITEFPIPTANSYPWAITSGPDGNLWFTEIIGNKIGRITPAGVIIEFPIPTTTSVSYGITSGPDGNLWFTENFASKLGRITVTGIITEYPLPNASSGPDCIISGADGNLWFTELGDNKIGQITTAGILTEYAVPTANSWPMGIASGSDGNLWFIELVGNKIGTLVIKNKPPTLTTAFGNATIPLGGITTLTFKITNPNPVTTLTGITFTDNLPPGLVVATPNNLTWGCSGTVTAATGSNSIKLEGGLLAANQSCTFGITVRGTTVGDKNNTSGPISASESGVGKPSNTAVLSVVKPSGPLSQLRFAHLAPANGSVDIYVNRQLALKNVSYSTVSPYLPYQPGNYAIDVVKAGAKLDTSDPLISEAIDLWDKEAYTYTILNFNDDPSANSYFYRDNLKPPATGTAKLKLLHALPNAEALDLAIQGGRVLFSGLNTGESSEYLQLPAGDYKLEVREAGTKHVLYQIPAISLQAGSLYTAIAEGLVSGSPAFKVVLVTDVSQ